MDAGSFAAHGAETSAGGDGHYLVGDAEGAQHLLVLQQVDAGLDPVGGHDGAGEQFVPVSFRQFGLPGTFACCRVIQARYCVTSADRHAFAAEPSARAASFSMLSSTPSIGEGATRSTSAEGI